MSCRLASSDYYTEIVMPVGLVHITVKVNYNQRIHLPAGYFVGLQINSSIGWPKHVALFIES